MVGKLLKHEIKEFWLEIVLMNVGILLISGICGLFIKTPNVIFVLSFIALILLYISVSVILIINIVRSFNTKIFSNEGYLTLTLPVSIDALMISKIIVNLLWVLITSITILLSISFIIFMVLTMVAEDLPPLFVIFEGIVDNPITIMISVFQAFLYSLFIIIILIFTLACLNTGKIKKFKLLVGILIYYGVNIITSWISTLIYIVPFQIINDHGHLEFYRSTHPLLNIFNPNPDSHLVILDFNNVFWLTLFIVCFYLFSRFLIKNKLELE